MFNCYSQFKLSCHNNLLVILIIQIYIHILQKINLLGSDENTNDSLNPGRFKSLVNFASSLDKDISDHLENSN